DLRHPPKAHDSLHLGAEAGPPRSLFPSNSELFLGLPHLLVGPAGCPVQAPPIEGEREEAPDCLPRRARRLPRAARSDLLAAHALGAAAVSRTSRSTTARNASRSLAPCARACSYALICRCALVPRSRIVRTCSSSLVQLNASASSRTSASISSTICGNGTSSPRARSSSRSLKL